MVLFSIMEHSIHKTYDISRSIVNRTILTLLVSQVLANTFMFLPDHLKLPGGLRDMSIVFLHVRYPSL
jgi:hypothetical protein